MTVCEWQPLIDSLWRRYVGLTPQAEAIHRLLRKRGDSIVNDHIALRTYSRQQEMGEVGRFFGVEAMAEPFLARGWKYQSDYRFDDKGLRARSLIHRQASVPKIFISELEIDRLSESVTTSITTMVRRVTLDFFEDPHWVAGGRPWTLTASEYDAIAAASEYGGWVAAFGFTANHFTVDVGALETIRGLEALCEVISRSGFELNDAGGIIKGGSEVLLAQASTRADVKTVSFADEVREIPSCFVEFAERFAGENGARYEGFVPDSADKIFESTDRRSPLER